MSRTFTETAMCRKQTINQLRQPNAVQIRIRENVRQQMGAAAAATARSSRSLNFIGFSSMYYVVAEWVGFNAK